MTSADATEALTDQAPFSPFPGDGHLIFFSPPKTPYPFPPLSSCQSPELISLLRLSVKTIQSRASPTKGSSPSNQAKKCSWGKGGGEKKGFSFSVAFFLVDPFGRSDRAEEEEEEEEESFSIPLGQRPDVFSFCLPSSPLPIRSLEPPFLPSVTAAVVPGHE